MNNTKTAELVTAENKVLRDTYRLLSMNLLTSSLASFVSMSMGIPPINVFIMLGVYFVLLYLVTKNEDNAFGVVATFLFTGWLGFTLGPYINYYISLPNGGNIVTNALLGTAIIFVSLSAWVTI